MAKQESNDLSFLEANVAATKEELDKAIAEYNAASSSLKDAKAEAEKLRKAVEALETSQRRTAANYFAWVGSSGATYAYNVLTDPNFNAFLEYTHLGDKNDATDLDNMLRTWHYLQIVHEYIDTTGFAISRGGTWSVTHGQQFSLVRDLWGEKPDSRVTYTVDEYRQSLLTYMSNPSSPELQAAKKAYEEALAEVTKAETSANAKHSARTRTQNAYDAALATLNEAQRPAKVGVGRLGGANRYQSSQKVFQTFFAAESFDSAFVATGRAFPDALSASAAAGSLNAPVLLVDGTTGKNVPSATLLRDMGVNNVLIVGGNGAVNKTIESGLRATFPNVTPSRAVAR